MFLTAGTTLHDIIVGELFDKKSLAALIFLIDAGRELEFVYENHKYFISRNKAKKYVSIWNDDKEQSFGSVYELIEKAVLQEKQFLNVWNEIKLDTLF